MTNADSPKSSWRSGELARATGLTVRTLRHYDAIGLLQPSSREANGYRVYKEEDVRRLYEVLALRRLGLPLGEIASALAPQLSREHRAHQTLGETLRRHLVQVEAELASVQRLRIRLQRALFAFDRAGDVPREQMLELLREMRMEKYFTPEQQAALEARATGLGPQGLAQAERDWVAVIAAFDGERAQGTVPGDPSLAPLVAKYRELMEAFTGGDPAIVASLRSMIHAEGVETATRGAMNSQQMDYVHRVMAASQTPP